MSDAETWKTVGLQILQVHTEECGDGSCGCGCGDLPQTSSADRKETDFRIEVQAKTSRVPDEARNILH